MRHSNRQVKFKFGQDANQMLTRKLLKNFLEHGKITTTETKVKYLKSHVDHMISLAKKNTEGSKNSLLTILGDKDLVSSLMTRVPKIVGDRVGGFTRSKRLWRRESDGTMLMKLEWVTPIVLKDAPVKPVEAAPAEKVTETKSGAKVTVRKAKVKKDA